MLDSRPPLLAFAGTGFTEAGLREFCLPEEGRTDKAGKIFMRQPLVNIYRNDKIEQAETTEME